MSPWVGHRPVGSVKFWAFFFVNRFFFLRRNGQAGQHCLSGFGEDSGWGLDLEGWRDWGMAEGLGGSLGTWRGGRMQGEGLAGRDGE